MLDTDIVVAGAAGFPWRPPTLGETRPLEAEIMERWLNAHWRWATSEELLEEHESLLVRLGAPEERARRIVGLIRERARIVVPRSVDPRALPDSDDAHVVGTVRAAGASLVTRNVDHFPPAIGIRVYAPDQMVEEIDRYLSHPMTRRR